MDLEKTVGGAVGVFENTTDSWVLGYTQPLHQTEVVHAELLGLYHGLILEKYHHFTPVIIETDSEVLLDLLKLDNPKCLTILSTYTDLLAELPDTELGHISRTANNLADALAKHGKYVAVSLDFNLITYVSLPPPFLSYVIIT